MRSTQAKLGSNAKPYPFDKPGFSHLNDNNRNENKETRTCFKCNKPGHVAKFCSYKGTASAFPNQQRSNKPSGTAAWNNACMTGEERPTSAAGGVDLQGIVASGWHYLQGSARICRYRRGWLASKQLQLCGILGAQVLWCDAV